MFSFQDEKEGKRGSGNESKAVSGIGGEKEQIRVRAKTRKNKKKIVDRNCSHLVENCIRNKSHRRIVALQKEGAKRTAWTNSKFIYFSFIYWILFWESEKKKKIHLNHVLDAGWSLFTVVGVYREIDYFNILESQMRDIFICICISIQMLQNFLVCRFRHLGQNHISINVQCTQPLTELFDRTSSNRSDSTSRISCHSLQQKPINIFLTFTIPTFNLLYLTWLGMFTGSTHMLWCQVNFHACCDYNRIYSWSYMWQILKQLKKLLIRIFYISILISIYQMKTLLNFF